MKKWVFLFAFLLAFDVRAELVLEGINREKVNFGDEFTLRGYIVEPVTAVVFFRLLLSCPDEQVLLVKTLSLTNNTKRDLSESFIIPPAQEGTCRIRAIVESGGRILDQVQSRDFVISRELNGNFRVDKQMIKLGDELKIMGEIFRLSGESAEGSAVVHFKQQDTDFFVDTVPVTGGAFQYAFKAQENPPGQYMIEIFVADTFGNQQTFTAGTISISNNITVVAEVDQLHTAPGDQIKIFGEASIFEVSIGKGVARVESLGIVREVDIVRGSFVTMLDIPAMVKTGVHDVTVFVTDEFGNIGTYSTQFIADPLPKRLEIALSKDTFQPGESVAVTPVLHDQTGEVIETDIAITIITPDKKEALVDVIPSNTNFEFSLLETATPGAWQIKAAALDVEEVARFHVLEKQTLSFDIMNESLTIFNRGNVLFEGPVEIVLDSFEKSSTLVREVSLGVNKSTVVDLSRAVSEGYYDVAVGGRTFKSIYIPGRKDRGNWLSYIIAFLFILIMLYLIYHVKKWRFKRRLTRTIGKKKFPRKEDGYVRMERLSEASEKKPLRFKIKKSDDRFVFDMPKKREKNSGWRKDDSGGGGLFGMFD